MTLRDLSFETLERALNAVIALDPDAGRQLAALHGRVVRITLTGIEKAFGHVEVLKGIDLDIATCRSNVIEDISRDAYLATCRHHIALDLFSDVDVTTRSDNVSDNNRIDVNGAASDVEIFIDRTALGHSLP